MGRPRTLHKRPAVHLLDAAASHATLGREPEPTGEDGQETETVSKRSRRGATAKSQRRTTGGTFA